MPVTWTAIDPSAGSGVDISTCLLEVREDEGTWQTFSTECGGDDTHDGQPGHTYTFRLSASDNVSNAASLEVQAVFPYVTKYYYANGQRVAMRQEGVVYYIHSDHLGSTSLTTDQSQQVEARQLYYPYGTPRWSQGTLPTDYTFTGQRDEAGIGLMHYGARFYSPRLGRFVSADSIVPEPGEPQALNRYAYARSNPVIYIDPSGHYIFKEEPDESYLLPPPQEPPEPPEPSGESVFNWMWKGMRVEGTYWILPIVAVDANLDVAGDIVYEADSGYSVESKLFFTLGAQGGLGEMGSINVGPVFTNADLEEYGHITNHAGGTLSDDVILGMLSSETGGWAALLGVEVDYGWAGGEYHGDEKRPQSVFMGVLGIGEELSGWAGKHLVDVEHDLLTGEGSAGILGHPIKGWGSDLTVSHSEP